MGIDAIMAIGGLILPPVFDFIKKKFLKKGEDTPEATISSLATTKPEILADYVNALANYTDTKVKWFNRDVIGNIPKWISGWRALIRPVIISFAIFHIGISWGFNQPIDTGIKQFYIAIISEWFGERLVLDR
jgi:hypothetical protein